MSYFHVIIEYHALGGKSETLELYNDLSRGDVESKLAKPYRKGKDIHVDGRILQHKSISKIRICKTEDNIEKVKDTLFEKSTERLDRLNSQGGGLVIVSPGGAHPDDIFEEGEDVTDQFNLEKESNRLLPLVSDRLLTIICSIIAIVIASFIAYKLGFK